MPRHNSIRTYLIPSRRRCWRKYHLHVPRRILHVLLAISFAISVLSLIIWPASYFWTVRITYVGSSSTLHCWTSTGQFVCMRQSGHGMPEFFRSNSITPDGWHIDSARFHPRYYDSVDRWNGFRESLRPQTRTTSMPLPSGRVISQRMIGIPFWPIAWLFAMPPAIAWQRRRLRRRRQRRGLCARCGYDLRASPGRCSECGFQVATDVKPQEVSS